MPRKAEMRWVESQTRWEKMVGYERLWVTCGKLGLPRDQWTKEGSIAAANKWFADKLPTIGKSEDELWYDHVDAVAAKHGREFILATLDGQPLPPFPKVDRTTWKPGQVATVATDGQSLKTAVDQWLASGREDCRAGLLSASTIDSWKYAIGHFVKFAGPGVPINTAITEDLWTRWRRNCESKSESGEISEQYGLNWLVYGRKFIRWAHRNRILDQLPNNLDEGEITVELEEPEPFTLTEVNEMYAAADSTMKLYILLALNAGMTQVDLARLTKGQVKLNDGVIIRQRSKKRVRKSAKKNRNLPTVTYPLWVETMEALKDHESDDPVLWLATKKGTVLGRSDLGDDDKLKHKDVVGVNFRRFLKRLNNARKKAGLPVIVGSFKRFRKVSPNLLNDSEHNMTGFYFLGHAPQTMEQQRYVKAPAQRMRAAITWLRTQYELA